MSTPGVGGAPPLPGATVADAAGGGMQAALAITAALAGRATTGHGAYLDVSVSQGVLWLTSLAIDEQLALGGEFEPGHDVLSGRYACYGVYAGSDGKWLAVGAIEAKFFLNLCRALGCEDLAAVQFDDGAQSRIRAAFVAAFGERTRDEWVSLLAGGDTCVAPVLSIAEVTESPQFAARGVVASASHPTEGALRQLAPLLAGMVRPAAGGVPVSLPDMTQTDTEHLLKEAGVDGETVARWVARQVVA
jgi:alpha-methylacyl-CoA racemase